MSIWFKAYTLEEQQQLRKGNILEYLDIQVTELGDDYIRGTMPVDHRTIQPYGLLHGGASVVLAESLGSIASSLVIDPQKFYCVGLDINANHLRAVRSGRVTGTAKPIHIGRSTHVWSIEIHDDENKLINISRLTMAIVPHPTKATHHVE